MIKSNELSGSAVAGLADVDRHRARLGAAKARACQHRRRRHQDRRRARRVAVAVGVTAHAKAVDADVQRVVGVVVLEAHVLDVPARRIEHERARHADIETVCDRLDLVFALRKILAILVLRDGEVDFHIASKLQKSVVSIAM
jgi:hypothetical protein